MLTVCRQDIMHNVCRLLKKYFVLCALTVYWSFFHTLLFCLMLTVCWFIFLFFLFCAHPLSAHLLILIFLMLTDSFSLKTIFLMLTVCWFLYYLLLIVTVCISFNTILTNAHCLLFFEHYSFLSSRSAFLLTLFFSLLNVCFFNTILS
jgi:hypothetical protein